MEKLTGEITMMDVVRRVNVPSLLILPAVANIMYYKPIVRKNHPPVPFYMLMWEYGLQTSLINLKSSIGYYPSGIVLRFSEEVMRNKKLTMSKYSCLNDRLCDSKDISNVWITLDENKNYYNYQFDFSEFLQEQVLQIMESKYTKVDKTFINMVNVNTKTVPRWKHNLGYYIMINNIPKGVLLRHVHIKNLLEEVLDTHIPESQDYLRKFNMEEDIYYYD